MWEGARKSAHAVQFEFQHLKSIFLLLIILLHDENNIKMRAIVSGTFSSIINHSNGERERKKEEKLNKR